MRLFINQEIRVLSWIKESPSTVTNSYCLPLSSNTVLVGPEAAKTFKSTLMEASNSLGSQLLLCYLEKGELVFLDCDATVRLEERPDIPTGWFPELVDDYSSWSSLIQLMQGVTRPGEDRQESFDRILGGLLKFARGIDLIDPWITPHLLEKAVQDQGQELFWLENLLSSDALNLNLYMSMPTTGRLASSSSFRAGSRSQSLSESQRMEAIQAYVANKKSEIGFQGNIAIRFHESMPHDRYLRFGMSKGSIYVMCPKGIDPFESSPISSVHKFSQLTNQDWSHVMKSPEWGDGTRDASGEDSYFELPPLKGLNGSSTSIFISKARRLRG
jgi:hypothetical protein